MALLLKNIFFKFWLHVHDILKTKTACLQNMKLKYVKLSLERETKKRFFCSVTTRMVGITMAIS